MRVFVAAMVAVFGIGMFAIAALAWDRRRQLSSGNQAVAGSNRRYLPHMIVLGCVLLGVIMVIGACAGLFKF
jgi:hypothetical protein